MGRIGNVFFDKRVEKKEKEGEYKKMKKWFGHKHGSEDESEEILLKKLKDEGIDQKDVKKAVSDRSDEARAIAEDEDRAQELIDKVEKLCRKLQNLPEPLSTVFADIPILCNLVLDYARGNYREIPLATVIVIIAGLLYLVSPIDLIPDAIPVVGLLDDGLVLLYVLRTAHNDLMSYEEWREENESLSIEECK